MTEQLEEKVYQISENYGVGADNFNIILFEKYQKMDSRGRNANPTGEVGWRPAKGGSYYSNLENMGNSIKNKVEKEAIQEVGIDFDKFSTYMDKWLVDLKAHLNEHITLTLGKVKDLSVVEEEGKKK